MGTATTDVCSHCQLPLPSVPYAEEAEGGKLWFCCAGCLMVFRLVGASGDEGRAGWFLAKLGLAAILSGNVMLFQSLLYFGSLQTLGVDVVRTASWIMLVLSAAIYLLLGAPMLGIAWRAARQRRLVLESLISLGALAALVASAAATLLGDPKTYYDSGTMVLVFVVLGRYLDARWRQKASEALPAVVARASRHARVDRSGAEVEMPPEEVRPGERVRVRAGEEIPVDGLVIEGASDIHEPALTGESVPRLVKRGDRVHAGAIARDGALIVEAMGGSEALADRIGRWIREARSQRSPMEQTADRYASRFIQLVVIIALGSGVAFGVVADEWPRGALAALAVLVVACPCALGIAMPMATTIALAQAAARGTILRSTATLDALARVGHVAFDKTGTITRGRPVVVELRLLEGAAVTELEVLSWAAAVETGVDHPFAWAIVEEARRRGASIPISQNTRVIPGGGAEGLVAGHSLLLGSDALLAPLATDGATASPSDDRSRVGVVLDGRLVAEILLRDPPRPEAREALIRLSAEGVSTTLLSGDRSSAVAWVAREVGFEAALANLMPGSKAEELQRMQQRRVAVAMVGDGVNDAPALAAAAVGIAFGLATDLARRTAPVAILSEDLREVPELLVLARRTMSIVRQNLLWAFGYNAIGIGLAAFGFLRPVVAAGAMVLSSLFVVGNSLRLRRPRRAAPP